MARTDSSLKSLSWAPCWVNDRISKSLWKLKQALVIFGNFPDAAAGFHNDTAENELSAALRSALLILLVYPINHIMQTWQQSLWRAKQTRVHWVCVQANYSSINHKAVLETHLTAVYWHFPAFYASTVMIWALKMNRIMNNPDKWREAHHNSLIYPNIKSTVANIYVWIYMNMQILVANSVLKILEGYNLDIQNPFYKTH